MLGKTVAKLEREMSSAELTEWVAFDREYTLPDAYFVAGQICATLAGRSPADYVPFFKPPKSTRPQTAAEQQAIVREHLAAARSKTGRV